MRLSWNESLFLPVIPHLHVFDAGHGTDEFLTGFSSNVAETAKASLDMTAAVVEAAPPRTRRAEWLAG